MGHQDRSQRPPAHTKWTFSDDVQIYACTHIFTYSHIHIFAYSHMHIFTYAHMHICTYSHMHIFKYSNICIFICSHIQIFNTPDGNGLCSATKRTSPFVESHFPLIQSPISRIRLMWVWHDSPQLTATPCNAQQHSPTQFNTLHGLGLFETCGGMTLTLCMYHIHIFKNSHFHIFTYSTKLIIFTYRVA